ncbi:hypothetical protein AMK22_02400 [Streptomyces sp. CB01580]|nr:hypothetical protein AMK22_02400 [Streptomyces sp. CB01580]
MTPLPGPPPGNAPPGARSDTPAHHGHARAGRRLLASLLFAVLTVVGGAPAAAGALYAGGPFAGAPPPPAAQAPDARQPIPHTDRTARTVTVHDARRVRTATATDGHRPAPTTGPGPGPRAGAEHNRAPQQLPPSDPDALLFGAPGIRTPHLQPRPVPAALSRTIDRLRVALPGVRGPPRTAVHRPPAPVRVATPARPPVVPSH